MVLRPCCERQRQRSGQSSRGNAVPIPSILARGGNSPRTPFSCQGDPQIHHKSGKRGKQEKAEALDCRDMAKYELAGEPASAIAMK
jgi:hypothetical protein